jgi:uncharacterized protein with PQ loop repeat
VFDHDLAITCGWIAVGLTFLGTYSQVRRVRRLGVEGVSLATWSLFILMGCFWISYGTIQHSAIIIAGSATILPLQLIIVSSLCRDRSNVLRVMTRSVGFVFLLCVVPTFFWGWSGGVYGAGVAAVLNRAPQIVELVRDPDVTGVSVKTWTLVSIGSVCWLIYYQNARLMAALVSVAFSLLANVAIALLASWRQRQVSRRFHYGDVVFTQA